MKLRQLTRADVAIGVALLVLLWAMAAPILRARDFSALTDRAAAEVETLRVAALGTLVTGAWPSSAEAGTAPPELSRAYPGDEALTFPGYALQWTRLAVIDYEEVPPVTLVAPDPEESDEEMIEVVYMPGDEPPDSVGPEVRPVVRRIGAIHLHSENDELLADLLARYGPTVSYVRGSTWTLVVDDRETGDRP